jgi:beta-glucosidase
MGFPKGFVWGVATAAYQIEGAAFEDGKGLSDWDIFCRKEGAIWNGQSGDVADDHYHRFQEDIQIMKQIGVNAYRLSLSWPRVIPNGVGTVNPKGLAFYDKLIDKLLEAGITPYITLFHWDYPYELSCRGGWLNHDSPDWFAEYAKVVVEKLSDRVKNWMTINEPQCFIGFGHQSGTSAPGLQLPFADVLRAGHNTLLGHGKAVQAIRAFSKKKCHIGLAPVGVVCSPATDSPEDINAARKAMFFIGSKDKLNNPFNNKDIWNHTVVNKNIWNNTWWMDPVFLGKYPEDGLQFYGTDVPVVHEKDMATIRQPLDFFGVNIYQGQTIRAGKDGQPEVVKDPVGHPLTAYHWGVDPKSLYWGPRFFYERYKLPVIMTENGMANVDWVAMDGKVHDPQRIDFLNRYLLQLRKASEDGVDIRGYFQWSLMDNLEWSSGYRERFGIVHVDFGTLKRTLKDSAYWYKEVIASNGASL